jgi:serine/threonine protein kinase
MADSTSLIGQTISHYRILEKLGGGGMGVVYKAEDSRLNRFVALKFLPDDVARDPHALARFKREAQAASALNHQNICTIHDIGEENGRAFIAIEYLEGQTLKHLIQQHPLPTDRVLDLTIQITDALDAAHARSIIHRDIKPANIFVSDRGQAKILDFGLAKVASRNVVEPPDMTAATAEASDDLLTSPGSAVGTVAYMSPEQVRGKELDVRTDLFSFGVVLYEMATGLLPFRGDTSGSIMDAILNQPPVAPVRLNPDVPAELERIINKALEKDRDLRYQSASDIRTDLKRLRRDTDSGKISSSGSAVAQPSTGLEAKRYAVLATSIALLAAAFAAYHLWPRFNTPSGPAKITQISQWNRPMNTARLSPDGHAVAFVSPVAGVTQVFLMLTSGGEPLQLTNDEADKISDNFSPDGKEIYYVRSLGRDEVWAVPTLGGAPRRVVSGYHAVPSPDGAFIYYAKSDAAEIFRSEKSGLNEEIVYNSEATGLIFVPVALFPGSNDLLAAGRQKVATSIRFYRINVTSHEVVDLGEVQGYTTWPPSIDWAEPGNSVLLSRTVNGITNIWKYSFKDRSLTQITCGTGPDLSPMTDPGAKGIYFVNGKVSGFLTAYHVHSKESTDIVSEDATSPTISSDGKRVMYVIFPAPERAELWVSDIDAGHKAKIAIGRFLITGSWAPDNLHLSFQEPGINAGDKVFIVGADGSGLRQLPRLPGTPINSLWSQDQKFIYVTSSEKASTVRTVWKWSVTGSSPEKVVDNCGIAVDADSGGQYLLGVVMSGEKTGINEVSISDKKCISLLPGVATLGAIFSRDGKSFLYTVASGGEATIYRQSWKNGKSIGAPQVALKAPFAFSLYYEGGNAYDFSRDLSTIVYARPGGHADLYLLSQK